MVLLQSIIDCSLLYNLEINIMYKQSLGPLSHCYCWFYHPQVLINWVTAERRNKRAKNRENWHYFVVEEQGKCDKGSLWQESKSDSYVPKMKDSDGANMVRGRLIVGTTCPIFYFCFFRSLLQSVPFSSYFVRMMF